jgi:hypothetical protein
MSTVERQKNLLKGDLFEVIVNKLLRMAGYSAITPDGVHIRPGDGHVRGRGYWHDIDALGRYDYPLFYMFPIRLLAEVKCYESDVPIWAVRNFAGALKDISENYFVDDHMTRENLLTYQRFTDCGSFFSASSFTIGAQHFALAQGIYLISYESNPTISASVDRIRELLNHVTLELATKNKKMFSEWFKGKLDIPKTNTYNADFIPHQEANAFALEFNRLHDVVNSIQTSAIGMTVGLDPSIQYPIHLLSNQKIPDNLFRDSDDSRFKVLLNETEKGLVFNVIPNQARQVNLQFNLPKYIYTRYLAKGQMLEFKREFIDRIELPMKVGNIRRILRLNLDREWAMDLMNRRDNVR